MSSTSSIYRRHWLGDFTWWKQFLFLVTIYFQTRIDWRFHSGMKSNSCGFISKHLWRNTRYEISTIDNSFISSEMLKLYFLWTWRCFHLSGLPFSLGYNLLSNLNWLKVQVFQLKYEIKFSSIHFLIYLCTIIRLW